MDEIPEYEQNLNLNEAREKFEEIRKEFLGMKKGVSGLIKKLTKRVNEKEERELGYLTGILSSLELEESVQKEMQGKIFEMSLYYKISTLNYDIAIYLNRLKSKTFGFQALCGHMDGLFEVNLKE